MKSEVAQSFDHFEVASPVKSAGTLPPILKEMQESFAVEGIVLSDEKVLQYASEFDELEKSGKISERISRVVRKRQGVSS